MTEAATESSLICKQCDQPMVRKSGGGPPPTYCSAKCRAKAGYLRSRQDGRYAEQLARDAAKRKAEREANSRPCPYCGDPLPPRHRVQCGKPECKRLWTNERNLAWQHAFKQQSGEWYARAVHGEKQREAARQRYADERARGVPSTRQLYPETHAKADAKRRARKAQAPTVEDFSPQEIFERDRWRCGVCHRKVNPGLQWPHPMSATLDHIVPLSKYGDHSRANTRLAHAGCNTSRGNRGGGEQLALIG